MAVRGSISHLGKDWSLNHLELTGSSGEVFEEAQVGLFSAVPKSGHSRRTLARPETMFDPSPTPGTLIAGWSGSLDPMFD